MIDREQLGSKVRGCGRRRSGGSRTLAGAGPGRRHAACDPRHGERGIDIITDGGCAAKAIRTASRRRSAESTCAIPARHQPQAEGAPRCRGFAARSCAAARSKVRDVQFPAREHRPRDQDHAARPFTMAQQAQDDYYKDEEALALAYRRCSERRSARSQGRWRRPDPARRALAPGAARARRALTREGDQPRARRHSRPTVVHLCFGYAAGARQAERLLVPAAARRHERGADLDRGAQPRSISAC